MCCGIKLFDSQYLDNQFAVKEGKQVAKRAEIAAIATLIASIAMVAIGIGLICAGYHAVGIPLVVIAIPTIYAAYNVYRTSRNLLEILADTAKWTDVGGNVGPNEIRAIKYELKRGTIGFECAVDHAFEEAQA